MNEFYWQTGYFATTLTHELAHMWFGNLGIINFYFGKKF